MTTTRHDDLSLKYVLSVPSGQADDATLPLAIVLHGRGADANDLADLAPYLDGGGGYRFVFPNAPTPFPWGGFTWFDSWPPERRSVEQSRQLLLRFIDEVIARHPNGGKVLLAGFSQGGMMSLDCGFRSATPMSGIISMSGFLYEDDAPDFAARVKQPVLICHGTLDDVVPLLAARRARAALEAAGLDPEYHEFPIPHAISPEEIAVVKEFVARCFGTA